MPLLPVLALFALAAGCAERVPFTQQLRTEYNLGPAELKQVQFYVSGPITLRRELSQTETSVTPGHGLKVFKEQRLEEVLIAPGTPGVATDAGPGTLDISFEEGYSLRFGADSVRTRTTDGRYGVLAEAWRADSGRLQYAGCTFEAVDASGAACLMVDLEAIQRFKKESRTLSGRTVE